MRIAVFLLYKFIAALNPQKQLPKRCSVKIVLRNFAKLTGKHLCQSLFFNNVAGLSPATLLRKRFWQRRFVVNFAEFLRAPFLKEHLQWLLLTLFRRGLFRAAHGWNQGAAQRENLSQISYNLDIWHSYTLAQQDSKNIKIMWQESIRQNLLL